MAISSGREKQFKAFYSGAPGPREKSQVTSPERTRSWRNWSHLLPLQMRRLTVLPPTSDHRGLQVPTLWPLPSGFNSSLHTRPSATLDTTPVLGPVCQHQLNYQQSLPITSTPIPPSHVSLQSSHTATAVPSAPEPSSPGSCTQSERPSPRDLLSNGDFKIRGNSRS